MIGGQHSLKGTHYRMVQIPASDKAVIDKKVKRNGVALLFRYAKRFGEGFDLAMHCLL